MSNLFEVKNLQKHFYISPTAILKAVDGVSLDVKQGETLGLVGESGCGKSTLGKLMLDMIPMTSGEILFKGQPVNSTNQKFLKDFRLQTQMIFQDPFSSLNPRMRVRDIVAEGIDIHKLYTGKAREDRIEELLNIVGLQKEAMNRYPHEFSGGQRQRIGIARAISLNPEFVVCDEPISALDVSIQAQIVNLLTKLSDEFNLTFLFISHDIKMVKLIAHRIVVMYLGKIVEIGESQSLFTNPMHPYTKALMNAIPLPNPRIMQNRESIILEGEIPSPINRQAGCVFKTRCPFAKPVCNEEPKIAMIGERQIACHFANELKL